MRTGLCDPVSYPKLVLGGGTGAVGGDPYYAARATMQQQQQQLQVRTTNVLKCICLRRSLLRAVLEKGSCAKFEPLVTNSFAKNDQKRFIFFFAILRFWAF